MSEEKGVRVESLFFLSNRVYMYKESTQEERCIDGEEERKKEEEW